jgi:FkbM family methyltransferase
MKYTLFCTRAETWDWHIVQMIFQHNDYHLPEDMSGETFVDIGGNIGVAAIRAAVNGAERVITYEPAKDNFRMLIKNIDLNNLSSKITAVRKAVGPKGRVTLLINTENPGSNTIFEDRNDFEEIEEREEVDMIPLSEVLADIDDCYLKVDCEGGEREIIKEIVGGLYKKIHTAAIELHYTEEAEAQQKALEKFYKTERLSKYEFKFTRK